jgi:hypothetical protein
MKTLYANKLKLQTVIKEPLFATVRIAKGTTTIRDGRVYKTEDAMRRNLKSRPANAMCIKIISRQNYGLIEIEEITK